MKKIILITACALICFYATQAQDQIIHPKQKFVDEEGTLYWPGELPMYVLVADNPEGNDPKRLESKATPNHANPLYLDSEGINFIRKKWAVNADGQFAKPQQEILFEFYRDSKPPVSTIKSESKNSFQLDGRMHFGKGQSHVILAKDQYAGVKHIYVSVNGAPYVPYSETLKFDADGQYEIKYYSVDNVGNMEEVKSYSFTMDLSTPNSKLAVKGKNLQDMLAPSSKISIASSDESSKVKDIWYSIDGGEDRRYLSELELSGLTDGEHTISYYAVDNTSNKEEVKTYSFYLDKIAPEVKSTIVGDQYQSRGRVFVSTRSKVKLEATDNKSGVKKIFYTINGGTEKAYNEPFDLPKSKGKYEIKFFAEDKVGNTAATTFDETKHGRQALDLDMEVPEIDFMYTGQSHTTRDTTFINSKTIIELTAKDEDSGVSEIGYKINGGEGKTYTKGFTLPAEGTYLIDYFATDNVSNRNIDQFLFVIDNLGPNIETIWSMSSIGTVLLDDALGSIPIYTAGVKLYLASTDNQLDTKSIFYTINDDAEKVYSLPIILNTKGLNYIKVRAIDPLNNESISETIQIFIK